MTLREKTRITNQDKKRVPLNKDVILLLKGLLIGKVLTLVVIGGVLWWLRSSLFVTSNAALNQSSSVASTANTTSNFQTVSPVPTGSFKYGGSPDWAPIRQLVDAQIQNTRPEFQLRYVASPNRNPSSNAGIQMLLDGKLDLAQSSRPLTAVQSAIAKQRGFTLKQYPVAADGIAVVVNRSLQVSGLTTNQLQQIYQGKITNWQQVGGPNLPIVPFSQKPQDADAVRFLYSTGTQQLGSNVQYVSSTTQALRKVSGTPGGLYYASARAVVPQCSIKPLALGRTTDQLVSPYRALVPANNCPRQRNQPNTEAFRNAEYPITYNLYVIVKHNQSQQQQAGEAYTQLLLSQQGQKALEQAGFTQPLQEDLASK